MRLLTHPKLIISLEEVNDIKYFKESWKGIINTVVFRDLINKSIQIYIKQIPALNYKTDKVLIISDTRELELIRKEDIIWLNKEISPIFNDLGISHQALIPPYAKRLDNLVEMYVSEPEEEKFLNLSFDNEKEGIEWFLNCIKKD